MDQEATQGPGGAAATEAEVDHLFRTLVGLVPWDAA
jgi:hypothetical protein